MSDSWMGSLAEQGKYNPEEGAFQRGIRDTPWFSEFTQHYGGEPNLEDPNYDYRKAWAAGARPEVRDPEDQLLHWPSQFKGENHPNRFVHGVDTITGAPGAIAAQDAYDVPLEQSTGVGWANRAAERLYARPPDNPTVVATTASPLVNITEGDIGRATEAAMGVSGGGLSIKGIKAYHSSPHDFDKFDLAKIGTGEGAQVYGHGLYFAENPAVSGQGGQYWQQFSDRFTGPEGNAATVLKAHGFDRDQAARSVKDEIEHLSGVLGADHPTVKLRQHELNLLQSDKPVGPRTYEVNINADPAHMLDWDKPPTPEVLAKVQAAAQAIKPGLYDRMMGTGRDLDKFGLTESTFRDQLKGESAYGLLKGGLKSAPEASQALAEQGIPGIKYLDQGSRALPGGEILGTQQTPQGWISSIRGAHPSAFNGGAIFTKSMPFKTEAEALAWANEKIKAPTSSNYVVFDPNIIDIMKKYGLAGAVPAGMGALAAQDQYEGN